ncbi:hypothetical protein QAD02_005538 [Eretmocerus hayati]|uniref:Uncharacterized protein n=1 Tax=Eretmocerus hayati TaxID=131215 RepID=A0ACC2NUI8_9HYME|nr:hypothetical protein QAD02_005538 [Eretmocerus hayati]
MTGCCVKSCRNSTAKGFRMGKIPEDPLRKLQWITNISRPNWRPNSHDHVCEVHFERNQWERRGASGRIRLKKTAIPTLFNENAFKERMTEDEINNLLLQRELNNQPNGAIQGDHIYAAASHEVQPNRDDQVELDEDPQLCPDIHNKLLPFHGPHCVQQEVELVRANEKIRQLEQQLQVKTLRIQHMNKFLATQIKRRKYFQDKFNSSQVMLARARKRVRPD